MLTGCDRGQDLRPGTAESPDDYVTKPFSIQSFVQRVESVLRRAVRPVAWNRLAGASGAVG